MCSLEMDLPKREQALGKKKTAEIAGGDVKP